MRKILFVLLVGILVTVAVLSVTGSVQADSPSCWFLDDWEAECDGWCEPGNASCDWPYADFMFDWPGTSWGGEADGNLNLSFNEPAAIDAGWAWGPFYCPVRAGQTINVSVDMKVDNSSVPGAGVAIGLFADDSVPLVYGGGMWYDNSVYTGSNGFALDAPPCTFKANYFALGVDSGDDLGNVYFFNTSGPNATTCSDWGHWINASAGPDGNWHNYALSLEVDTGNCECFWDGEYMGIVHADDMAGKDLYFQLYGIGGTGSTVWWDNFLLDSGGGSPQDSSIGQPYAPTNLLVDNVSNTCMYNSTPNMSCIAWHSTSTAMNYQQIMVATDSVFNYKVWDSGLIEIADIYSGQQSDIIYDGSSLIWNTRYYWRTRFIDCYGVVGDWSDTNWFVYGVLGCGVYGEPEPPGIFPPSDVDWYDEECSPSIFLKESWEAGAASMGFECPRTFEQMVLGLMAIPIGFAAALAVGHIWAGLLAMIIWFGGLAGMHVYPWWIIIAISTFILALWFTLRRVGN